jgi:hypothetical protein
MKYEEFRNCWTRALDAARLQSVGRPAERLGLGSLDRSYEVFIEPLGGQDAEPWFVTAHLEWRWEALHSARTATTEEDLLVELLGREKAEGVETFRPWVRVDITLNATLPWGAKVAMPRSSRWRSWHHEVVNRLDHIEPVLPADPDPLADGWRALGLAVPGWIDVPSIEGTWDSTSGLLLHKVALASWQPICLPRQWDDSERHPDDPPDVQVQALIERLRAALHAWMECLDHLQVRIQA